MSLTLETAERLAELHVKRARLHELEQAAQRLKRDKPDLRPLARMYAHACHVLHVEIQRLEALALAEMELAQ